MNIHAHHLAFTLVACGFALTNASIASADTITLKSAARQRAGSPDVVLGDIASLEGAEALRLAGVRIATFKPGASARPLEVSVVDVRRALDAANANWAKINLSGRAVIVRPARDGDSQPPQAMASVAIESEHDDALVSSAARTDPTCVALDALVTEPTVRGSIASLIIANLRVDPRDLRVRINAVDLDLLGQPLESARFEIQPLGSLAGDRLAFAVRSWNGGVVKDLGQITVLAERQALVTRAKRDLVRGTLVVEADLETASTWLSPSEAMQATAPAAIVGRCVSRSLKQGEVIRARDVERETLIQRGDMVTVRCLVGGVAISLQAEARADGSLGDVVELRKIGERETFRATIAGKGQAVVDLTRK